MTGPNEPMTDPDISVERSMVVDAAPDIVWEHVVDGTLASEWMGSPMTIDPRVGGGIGFAPDGVDFIGTVEELEQGRSITWSWRHPERDPSQVIITVVPEGDGSMVTVVERLLPYTVTDTRTRWPVVEERWLQMAVRLAA